MFPRNGITILVLLVITICGIKGIHTQVSLLDALLFRGLYRATRDNTRNSRDAFTLNFNRKLDKLQHEFPQNQPFFCDTNGPGARSATVPTSVHKLTPGDIDIIGAFGDSLSAGCGAMATSILQITTENRGLSWSIGGQDTWHKFLTLPNLLKVFNPNLYGYSLGDSHSFEKASKFNTAEFGAMSRDIPHMSQVLVRRIQADPKVDLLNHWKLITLLIGPNDYCSDMCYMKNPELIVDYHENHLLKALRTIRDNLPRTMVNVVITPTMKVLLNLKGTPNECIPVHVFECPCMFGAKYRTQRKRYLDIQEKWKKRQFHVVYREEFQNRTDFAVNLQLFTEQLNVPFKDNKTDFSFMSTDCFHFSQKSHALAATALWNNMLEPFDNKSRTWTTEFFNVKCPTAQRPYLATLKNSIGINDNFY